MGPRSLSARNRPSVQRRIVPSALFPGQGGGGPGVLAFYFPDGGCEARCICMVQYRTFLGGQLRESILGPIGSEPGPHRTREDATRAVTASLPPFPPSATLSHDTLRTGTLTRPMLHMFPPRLVEPRRWTSHRERLTEGEKEG